jgi:hypothetical protein
MVFIEYPKQGITLFVGFGGAMKYPSKFQKICYGVQSIFKIPCEGYILQMYRVVLAMNNFPPIA